MGFDLKNVSISVQGGNTTLGKIQSERAWLEAKAYYLQPGNEAQTRFIWEWSISVGSCANGHRDVIATYRHNSEDIPYRHFQATERLELPIGVQAEVGIAEVAEIMGVCDLSGDAIGVWPMVAKAAIDRANELGI